MAQFIRKTDISPTSDAPDVVADIFVESVGMALLMIKVSQMLLEYLVVCSVGFAKVLKELESIEKQLNNA